MSKTCSLRNGNWKFYGLRDVNRKNFRFTKLKLENFRFPFDPELPGILVYKFPDHSISKMEIFSGKMETLHITNAI